MRNFKPARRAFLGALACLACLPLVAAQDDAKAKDQASVKLVIDFGDGLSWQFDTLAHKPGMTVLDAMTAAKARSSRPLAFEHKGSGESAFLQSIDGTANEGGGGSARNWFFRVNGKLGQKSFGLQELEAGDTVLWHFGKYRPGQD